MLKITPSAGKKKIESERKKLIEQFAETLGFGKPPRRRSTDAYVILHARAEDHPPTIEEEGGNIIVRTATSLTPHGTVRLPNGSIVGATCLGNDGKNFVRSHASLDPDKVKFSH